MSVSTATVPTSVTVKSKHRVIKKAAVLGAGIMGSRIAMHFANIGLDVLLLDIAPRELTPEETAKGLTLDSPAVKNRIVNQLFKTAFDGKPSPIYDTAFASRIKLGNFTDDLPKIADCDWVLEVVVERLDIKQQLFENVEKYRKPGSLMTSNTSGIPMEQMTVGRSEDFVKNFFGTHFFNPPRYLPLLEIIPSTKTDPEVIDFMMKYGDLYLGKKTVLCKDTPAFIANRIGIYAIMDLFYLVEKHGLTVEEVDKLTGPLIGHASSATFRTCDLVGLDTAVKVAKGIYDNCPNDERRDIFKLPAYIQYMVDNNLWGDKTEQGFFKKTKNAEGKTEILSLDLNTKEFKSQIKPKSATLDATKSIEEVPARLRAIMKQNDTHAKFLKESTYGLFSYVSYRVPEISDDLYQIDAALNAGFGWKYGPFETWDIVGVEASVKEMLENGFKIDSWVTDMLDAGIKSFYTVENGVRKYYDVKTKAYQAIPGANDFIILDNIRSNKVVWKNIGTTIFDLGDDVLCLEFNTKMNTLGGEVLEGIHKAIDMAEKDYKGLVIGNQGENFSVGANLMMIFMFANEGDWDELDFAVRTFQNTIMRVRYSGVPVVVAPHGLSLGGGCEMSMHADRVQAAAETYIGLVEVGVGLLPGGGGTKEFAVRLSDQYRTGDVETNVLTNAFMTVAQAKVATSAYEAYNLGIFRKNKDYVSVNKSRQIADAKRGVIEMYDAGYTQPLPRKDVRVLGRHGLGMVYAGTYAMEFAGYASAHDRLIAEKIGYVLCGGDLSATTQVSEQYLLDLEREAFLSLAGTKKTLERIQHMLQTGKPLRN